MKKCGHRCVAAGPGSDMDAKGFWVTVGLIGPEQKVPQTRAQVTYFYSNQHRFDVHSLGVCACVCMCVCVCVCTTQRQKYNGPFQPTSTRQEGAPGSKSETKS